MKHNNDLKRIIVLFIFALLIWIVLILRMIQIQLIDRGRYVARAKDQYIRETKLTSFRGNIYDRNFNYLAINRPVLSLGVDLSRVTNPDIEATQIADFLGGDKNYYLKQLTNGNQFCWLKRGVEENIVPRLENLHLPGLRIIPEMKRAYPQNKLAANLIGFTDVDLNGLSGVELVKNEILHGKPGRAFHQLDALGKKFTPISYSVEQPQKGEDVILTIDNSFQLVAEEELTYTINQHRADGGMVIVADPFTGEILAMAVRPTFNPNIAGKYPPQVWRNRSITDTFEPGSTFKPIFMSAILEEELKKPDDIVYCEQGKYKYLGQLIEDVHDYGWLTLRKIIANSSNIGMTKLAQEVKKEIIYKYASDFGFGVRTGIELHGEVTGALKNTTAWSRYTPAALVMGYEVSVTALQLTMAYCAIANGGTLLKPIIFRDVKNREQSENKITEPIVIRQVVSKQTSQILKSMLEEVVIDGTGKRAAIPGFRIAGKTGTTRKYDRDKKAYSTKEFISSFVGFFPVDKPKFLICVVIDNPQGDYFGGIVAATTFKKILQRMIRTTEIDSKTILVEKNEEEENDKNEETYVLPNFVSKKLDVCEKIGEDLELRFNYKNNGDLIIAQDPAPGTIVNRNSLVTLTLVEIKIDKDKYTRVPKVIGLAVRDALNRFSLNNLNVMVKGSGRVVRQNPEAGEIIRVGARCVIECEPLISLASFQNW